MIKEIQYTNIRRVLDNLMEHPLLRDITLEQVVRYVIRFISLHGYPKMFQDKIENVDIKDFRGILPCDLISITQVKDLETGLCLRAMTDTFPKGLEPSPPKFPKPDKDLLNNVKDITQQYISPAHKFDEEPSFKTQGRIIFTSFPEGCVEIAYRSIPVDKDGFPLLIDNENYLACLEAYIKKQVFTVKFDQGKIASGVLQNVQQEYAWLAGQLQSEMTIPSYSEMESIGRYIQTILPSVKHFDNGFRDLGQREYIRKH